MPPETYPTVRQCADALAREARHVAWRRHRNEPLDQLFRAIWLDQFGDETTPCLLSNPDDVKDYERGIRRRPEQCAIRVLLWRSLPKGDYWVPSAVRTAREGEYLWQEIAALSWDDYDDQWRRRIIEPVVILKPGIEQWKVRHWTGKPKTGGRPPGSGSYAGQDAPLVKTMNELIANGTEKTPHAAAWAVVHLAEGRNTSDMSKVKRLIARYKESYGK